MRRSHHLRRSDAGAPPAPSRPAAGIWTLLFSRLILNEPLTRIKLATVLISMAGMILVTFSSSEGDADDEDAGDAAAGNAAALMSAAASGIYVVLLRACVPDEVRRTVTTAHPANATATTTACARARKHSDDADDDDGSPRQARVHMPSLFGMIGAISAVATLPLFPLLHYANIER